jgi:hypothetical protein
MLVIKSETLATLHIRLLTNCFLFEKKYFLERKEVNLDGHKYLTLNDWCY